MAGDRAMRLANPCRRRGRSRRPHQCEVAADNQLCETQPDCNLHRNLEATKWQEEAGLLA